MNNVNDYNIKLFGLHMKNDQVTVLQGAFGAKNVKPATHGAVKNQIETTPVDPEMRLTSLKFLHYGYLQQFQ